MRDKIFFSFSVEGKIRMKKQRLWPNWKINAQKWNNHLKRTIFDIWLFEELESEKQKEANFIVMETVKQIPYGMSNFEDVIMQNRYYVDKTMYIPLLEDQANYLIFIRPRRFGKSLLRSRDCRIVPATIRQSLDRSAYNSASRQIPNTLSWLFQNRWQYWWTATKIRFLQRCAARRFSQPISWILHRWIHRTFQCCG